MDIERKITQILGSLSNITNVNYIAMDQGQVDNEDEIKPLIKTPAILISVQGTTPIITNKCEKKNKLTIHLRLFVETPLIANVNAPGKYTHEYLNRFHIIENIEKLMKLDYAQLEGWSFIAQRKSMSEYCIKISFTEWY